jgi:hypothetical protein
MSEAFPERLSRFTPDGSGLDRDALLFTLGKASARPNRRWQALAFALALSQALTLALLWPRAPGPAAPDGRPDAVESPYTPARAEPEIVLLTRRALEMDGGRGPRPAAVAELVPPRPPLRALAAAAADFD